MGASTRAYVFSKISREKIKAVISELPNTTLFNEEVKAFTSDEYTATIRLEYKGKIMVLNVSHMYNSNEYTKILNKFARIEDIKQFVPSYGDKQAVIQFKMDCERLSVEFLTVLLKQFEGFLIINDFRNDLPLDYINKIDNTIYYNLKNVPNEVLNNFVKEYLTNNDMSKINKRLKAKVKGANLLKEFAIRNVK